MDNDSPVVGSGQLVPPLTSSQAEPAQHALAQQGSSVDPPVSPLPPDARMDEEAKQEFLWHTHQYLNDYARFADTKAAFAGTIAIALLGALYSAKVHVPMLQVGVQLWNLTTGVAAVSGSFLIASVFFAISTVRPRLRSTQSKGFIFWQSIRAHGSLDLLKTSFDSQSARTLNENVLHHNFDISAICVTKYREASLSIAALTLGALLCAATLVLQDRPENALVKTAAPAVTVAPPCTNGLKTCESWERDWGKSKIALKPGSIVTKDGFIIPPQQ